MIMLRGFDLNLLVILEATLSEASITRAALRLRLTQPAVSQALNRARELFGDKLLTRKGAAMELTPRAQRLLPELKEFCAKAETLFSTSGFDPASSDRTFTITANDVSELLILPPVISAASYLAPRARIIVRSVEPSFIDHAVDLAVIGAPLPPGAYSSADLYEDHFVILARPDHPGLKGTLSPEDFASLSHVLVSPTGGTIAGPIDDVLKTMGLARRISLSVTRFTTLPKILASTNFISAVPSRFAALSEVQSHCRAWPLPFESPMFRMRLLWHSSQDADPAHRWLRELFFK